MRLAYWSEFFWPSIGGVEVLGGRFLVAMRDRGYEPIVLTSHHRVDSPEQELHEGIPILRFPIWSVLRSANPTRLLEVGKTITTTLNHFKPDVMHVNASTPTLFFSLRSLAMSARPHVVALRGSLDGYGSGPNDLFSRSARSASWVTSVSTAILHDARRRVPEIAGRSSVIYNGLAAPPIDPTPLSFAPTRLLCLGRLIPDKGFDLALQALGALVRRYSGVEMIVAGNGRARPELERQAAAAGLANLVRFIGWVAPEAVFELINSVTIVVMPSRTEGLPQVAIQAALMGRPVVGTRIPGLSEVVADRETGVLVDERTGPALADAIRFLIEHQDEARRMGDAARNRARTLFQWERYLETHDNLYRTLAKRG